MNDDSKIPELQVEPLADEGAGKDNDPNIGRMLKQTYTLTKKVGEGGMGNVYLALQSPLNRQVAIKMLKPTDNNPEGEHYFMREVQAINMLRHPNIIQIVDFGKEPDGTLYLVMEYLPGKTLKRVIRKEHPLDPKRICRICIQILSALEQAHESGIVHCDLKPANIMLERVAGQDDFVKVLDFGIAKVKGPAMEAGPYTQAGNIVGTFDYMSPEQIMRKDLDGRADVWSLGVIIYEMLTRKRLFHDRDAVSIIGRVMQLPITPVEEVLGKGSIPPELDRIVMTALQRNVAKRFESAAQMRQALEHLQRQLEAGGGWTGGAAAPGQDYGHGDTGAHSGPLTSHSGPSSSPSSLVKRGGAGSGAGAGSMQGEGSRTGISSIVSRSGNFASTELSSRLATGIAQGTSVLDQTFSIEALQDSLLGERRKVAVLVVQQRARRAKGVDPEELAQRSAQEAKLIKEVVDLYDGEIDSFLGGTYTVLFGARKTRVGDNVRAVQCAKALQERFALLSYGSEHLGMGLAYGEIFLASRKGGNAFGATIDRAIDIARQAAQAKILADESLIEITRQQVSYDAPRALGGEAVAEVLDVREAGQQREADEVHALRDAHVVISRPKHFEELLRRAAAVKDGQGGGVALIGQVGAGKTTLLEQLMKNRQDQGWQVFHVSSAQAHDAQVIAPIRHWIRQIAQTYKDPKVLIQKACESIGLRRGVDAVAALYVGVDDAAVSARELPWQDQSGYLYFSAALFHRMVRFAMKKGPVMLSVDNLNTADAVCMDLLDAFIPAIQKMAVLVMTTKRLDREVYEHGLPGSFELMTIEGLEPQETRQYIAQLLGYTPPQDVLMQLHARASGNPLFLKEMLRALLKRGGLESLGKPGALEAAIPLNLHQLLAERVDELPDHLRDLLAIASVLGESFREDFFYQVTPAHLAPELGLKDLLATNLFEAREDGLGRASLAFNPRSLRTVVYERLPKQSRQQIHRTIIEFLEGASHAAAVDPLDVPALLAFHYRSVEDPGKASYYMVRVGELLLDLYDYAGAISSLQEALSLLEGKAPPHHDLIIHATIRLLTAYRESGRVDEAQLVIDRLPPLTDISAQFHAELLLEIGSVGMEAGRLDRSMEALFKVVELARRQQNIKLEVKGLLSLAQLFEKENQLQRAANLLVEVSKKVELIGDLDMTDPDDRRLMWTAYNQLGTLFIRQRDIQSAQQYLQLALQQAQKIQDHRGLVRVLSNLGALFLSTRDVKNATQLFQSAVEMAKATGDMLNQSRILTNLGIVSMEAQDLEAAKEHFRQARSIAEEIGWYEGLAELAQHIKRLRQLLQS